MSVIEPAPIRPGARALLGIVAENDRHSAFVANTALWLSLNRCMDLTAFLQRFCGKRENAIPTRFIELVSFLLADLRHSQANFRPLVRLRLVAASDFDLQAFQGFALTLADICWPERDATDAYGPSCEDCYARISVTGVGIMQWLVLQHYFGNVLQYIFHQARVRQKVSGLPSETEIELRQVDALNLCRRVQAHAGENADVNRIWTALDETWHELQHEL